MRPTFCVLFVGLMAAALLAGCVSPSGDTAADQRQAAQRMRSETLVELYRVEPRARTQIAKAAGYAVFTNVGVNVILLSAGNGWGVARDNRSGEDIYMKMASAGIGPGLGFKDFRAVFVFTTRAALEDFVNDGWDASAQAAAETEGAEARGTSSGAIDVAEGVKLYQITDYGLAVQATIQGTKYWRDEELNGS